jgi:hypothetical protein
MRNLTIETNLYYDIGLSQIIFDENFKSLTDDSFLFLDYGNLKDNFDKEDFFIIDYENTKKRNINKLKVYLADDFYNSNYIRDHSFNDLICIFFNYGDLDDLEKLLNDYNISYKKTYSIVYITGYSQGDTAQILTNKEEYKKLCGTDFKEDEFKEYFTNLFYKTPLCGELNIFFEYTTQKGINHKFDISEDNQEFFNDSYEINFNYDYIFNSIKLIDYNLNEDEKKEIIKELSKIDYTDISYG